MHCDTRYRASCLCEQRAYFTTEVPELVVTWLEQHATHVGVVVEVVSHARLSSGEFGAMVGACIERELAAVGGSARGEVRDVVMPVRWRMEA